MRLKNKPAQDDRFFHDSVPLPPKTPYAREEVEQVLQDNATEETLRQWKTLLRTPGMDEPLRNPIALLDEMQPRTIVEGSAIQILQVLEENLPRAKYLAAKSLLPLLLHRNSEMTSIFFTYGEQSRVMWRPMEARDYMLDSIILRLRQAIGTYAGDAARHAHVTNNPMPSKLFQARDKAAMRAFLSILSDVKENTAVPVFLSQDSTDKPRSWHRGLMADYVAFKVGEELEQLMLLGRGTYGLRSEFNDDTAATARMIVERIMGYSQRGSSNAYRDRPIPPIAEILLDNRGCSRGLMWAPSCCLPWSTTMNGLLRWREGWLGILGCHPGSCSWGGSAWALLSGARG